MALAACTTPAARTPSVDGGGPRLVVLIVIDQLPSWSFVAREHLMTRGIGRLLHEGRFFPNARYPYAATYTAPGHTALGTGAPPSVSGIVANEWWDLDKDAARDCVDEPRYPALLVDGWLGQVAGPASGAAPVALEVDGIGDSLKAATGGKGRAVGVSLKSRAAMLPLGRHGGLAVWYDEEQRAFTTSTWFAGRVPEWVARLRRTHPIPPRLAAPWQPLDAALLAREAQVPDDAPGEAANLGPGGGTFPHVPAALHEPASAIKMSPLGNTVVREAAVAAVEGEQLGRDDVPDLLVVSFSAHDYVGHEYGQESWEALDTELRLDGEVGELLDALDARVGPGRYAVVLASDHGGPRMTEQMRAAGRTDAVRVDMDGVRAAVEAAVAPVAGAGPWLSSCREPAICFTPRFRTLPAAQRDAAVDAAVAALRAVDGIGYAYRTDRIGAAAGDCDARPPDEAVVCRAVFPRRSGDIIFGPRAGSMIRDKEGDPIAHGSPNEDDTTVPVIVWGPGVAHGRVEDVVSSLQVAPTLAKLLRVPPPSAAKAAPLPVGP